MHNVTLHFMAAAAANLLYHEEEGENFILRILRLSSPKGEEDEAIWLPPRDFPPEMQFK